MILFICITLAITGIDIVNMLKNKEKKDALIYSGLTVVTLAAGIYFYNHLNGPGIAEMILSFLK